MQINDFCDIAAVWGLVYVMFRYVKGDNAFAAIPEKVINHFLLSSFFEILLELFISTTFPIIVRRFTRYKDFSPLKYGKDAFFENLGLFCLVVINLFTFAMLVMNELLPGAA